MCHKYTAEGGPRRVVVCKAVVKAPPETGLTGEGDTVINNKTMAT